MKKKLEEKKQEKEEKTAPLQKFQRYINGQKVVIEAISLEAANILFDKFIKNE